MSSERNVLKPCPFCGQRPAIINDDSYGHCFVRCNCDFEPFVHLPSAQLDEAISKWNAGASRAILDAERRGRIEAYEDEAQRRLRIARDWIATSRKIWRGRVPKNRAEAQYARFEMHEFIRLRATSRVVADEFDRAVLDAERRGRVEALEEAARLADGVAERQAIACETSGHVWCRLVAVKLRALARAAKGTP